MNTNLYSILLG